MINISYTRIGVRVTAITNGLEQEISEHVLEDLDPEERLSWEIEFADLLPSIKGASEYNADDRIEFLLRMAEIAFELDEDDDTELIYTEVITYSD